MHRKCTEILSSRAKLKKRVSHGTQIINNDHGHEHRKRLRMKTPRAPHRICWARADSTQDRKQGARRKIRAKHAHAEHAYWRYSPPDKAWTSLPHKNRATRTPSGQRRTSRFKNVPPPLRHEYRVRSVLMPHRTPSSTSTAYPALNNIGHGQTCGQNM